MKLIVGLGNTGEKYEYTKHNTGFLILNAYLSKKIGNGLVWLDETKFHSHMYRTDDAIYVKPQTFMNKVGEAVQKIVRFYKVDLNDLLVIHDDVDLPLGEFKLKKSSGSAGHHGVEDIFAKLGTEDFWRLRVGVGRPDDNRFDIEAYVLEQFTKDEVSVLFRGFEADGYKKIEEFIV